MSESAPHPPRPERCRVVVIWIDWYPYHVARFAGLLGNPAIGSSVTGIELVGGMGVHAGLKFREPLPPSMPIQTLLPESNWKDTSQLKLAVSLWRRLAHLDPDVVLVPGYYTLPGIAAALWARLHDRTSVLMTESTRADHPRVAWKEALKSLILRALFDWAVTGGQAHRAYLDDLGFPQNRVARFYDVVDNHYYHRRVQEVRRQGSAADFHLPNRPYFLYVGRLASEKNVNGLLEAYLRYRDLGGDLPLVLVGDGPEAADLRRRAAASAFAAEITFPGHKTSADLPLFYAFAACFVLPSTREPWGLVVNEAMASGLPVIVSSRCGCAADLLLEGRTGLLFDPAEEDGLTRALATIGTLSPAARQTMGAAAAEQVAHYSPEALGQQIASIAES